MTKKRRPRPQDPKPVRVNTDHLSPLPETMRGVSCALCDKPQANWELRPRENALHFICSLCLMYSTTWGKKNRRGVERIIRAIEASGQFAFRRHRKRLAGCGDADRVMGAIAYSSKIFDVQDRAALAESELDTTGESGNEGSRA